MPTSWKPLLEGTQAADALQAVRDIAAAIAVDPTADAADRTVFWAYAAPVIETSYANTAYDVALDDLVAQLQTGARHTSLYDSGLAGLGWTLTHILDGEDSLVVLDEALVEIVKQERATGGFDLAQGLTGIGVYFLERLVTGGGDAAREGLEVVVDGLARCATVTEHGITWLTAPEHGASVYREAFPDGFYDCGLAHGTAGVIAFLGRAAALDDKPAAPRKLCDAALRWIAAQRQDRDPAGRFPAIIANGVAPERARAAWCYGDPGVAVALWGVASRLGTSSSLALETAHDCATRAPETCGIRDSALCHGTAGIAHLCNRFFQASGDTTFRDAARDWYTRTLTARGPANDGIGGFSQWRGDEHGWQPASSLIDGAIGVGLSLISAISETEPSWDRMLLCDVPLVAKGA
jgi:lantibiotic biosynthesis protein